MGEYTDTMLHACAGAAAAPLDFSSVSAGNEAILDHISTGILFVDRDGILAFLNRRAEQFLHVSRTAVVGKRIDMLPLRTPVYRVLSENCREHPVKMNVHGRILSARSRFVGSLGKGTWGEIIEISDVTDEKAERQRREEFVAMMTHDLKGPLAVMLGNVQAIRLGMLGKVGRPLQGHLQEIEKSGLSLRSMIEEVIDVYRLERGLLPLERQRCSIRRILANCRHAFQHEAKAKGVSLTLTIKNRIGLVNIDPRQMTRVFYNLLCNAIKFTPACGSVDIAVRREDAAIAVSISDTGVGIPEQELPRIFGRYYRSVNAAGVEGSGLGLTISRAIVEAHGGCIEVFSKEGEGSCFTVALPLHVA